MGSEGGRGIGHVQAYHAEDDDEGEAEDVGDAEGEAEDDAEYADPARWSVSFHCVPLPCRSRVSLVPLTVYTCAQLC